MERFGSLARRTIMRSTDAAGPTVGASGTEGQGFEEFFREEFPNVVRLAYALTRSDTVAQDAAQHAFAQLYERFTFVSNPAGFVRTVAINNVRDQHRHLQVRTRALDTMAAGHTDAPWDLDYLADALAVLSPERRAMIVLRFYERRTVPEIAEILGLAEGTVKSGLARSLDQLRKVLT